MNTDQSVLLLEDNDFEAAVTREILEKCCTPGFKVDRVRLMREGQDELARNDYGVALIDMNVPDSHGLDTVRNMIRANGDTPIIVLGEAEDAESAIETLRLGAQDFIPKSDIDSRTLQRVISHAKQRKEQESELFLEAYIDRLTGLGNRALLYERWRRSLARSKRVGRMAGVLIIGIDRFNNVNDAFGHAAGDAVLQQYASKLSSAVRESDIVARLGGDEFVVVLECVRSMDEVVQIRAKLYHDHELGLNFDGSDIAYTASIGAAITDPHDGEDLMAVLKRADMEIFKHKTVVPQGWNVAPSWRAA